MICDKYSPDHQCHELHVGRSLGWMYCKDCFQTGRLRDHVLKWMEAYNIIPFNFVFKHPEYTVDIDAKTNDDRINDRIKQ
jgi:hypothetical protein